MERKQISITKTAHAILKNQSKKRKKKNDEWVQSIGNIASEYIIEYAKLDKSNLK